MTQLKGGSNRSNSGVWGKDRYMQRGGAEGSVSNQGCEIPTIKLFTYSEQSCQDVPKAFYGIKYLSRCSERRTLQIDTTDF